MQAENSVVEHAYHVTDRTTAVMVYPADHLELSDATLDLSGFVDVTGRYLPASIPEVNVIQAFGDPEMIVVPEVHTDRLESVHDVGKARSREIGQVDAPFSFMRPVDSGVTGVGAIDRQEVKAGEKVIECGDDRGDRGENDCHGSVSR